ncbi:hypothetical protein [Caulobacter sp. DWR3-1-2]|uniref:hypothetical protein n=1 Tax=Caulobacter sp. DWR3-1-2 TaxID=2804647 RepID=UPI003CFA825E
MLEFITPQVATACLAFGAGAVSVVVAIVARELVDAKAAAAQHRVHSGKAADKIAAIVKGVWLAGYDRGRFSVASKAGTYADVVPKATCDVLLIAALPMRKGAR